MTTKLNQRDLSELREEVEQLGWRISPNQLAEGGGGTVFTCTRIPPTDPIKEYTKQILSEQDENKRIEIATKLFSQAITKADTSQSETGAFKSSKHADGRMRREIKALTQCHHPNLVKIHLVDPKDEPNWFIMEYFRKGDLTQNSVDYQGNPLEVLIRARALAEALVVVHENKMVHRDIKPSNIFLADDGRWVLGDFGITHEAGATRYTEHGAPMTKDWRPDWIVSRHIKDWQPTVDIFLLAKVIYTMIAGPEFNPPASQIQHPDFDLRLRYPSIPYIGDIQDFLSSHITTSELTMRSTTAQQFIARIDELIARFSWRKSQHQILSFISSHSMTHINAGDLWRLQDLRIHLPAGSTLLKGTIRLISVPDEYVTHISFSIKEPTERTWIAKYSLEINIEPTPRESLGSWVPFEMRLPPDLQTSWYQFDITKAFGVAISALILHVEALS